MGPQHCLCRHCLTSHHLSTQALRHCSPADTLPLHTGHPEGQEGRQSHARQEACQLCCQEAISCPVSASSSPKTCQASSSTCKAQHSSNPHTGLARPIPCPRAGISCCWSFPACSGASCQGATDACCQACTAPRPCQKAHPGLRQACRSCWGLPRSLSCCTCTPSTLPSCS